jgi:hypothetical protein
MDSILRFTQATSGLLFSSFSLLHFGGHLFSNISLKLGQDALLLNRRLFHHPVYEIGIIGGSLLLHAGSSILLMMHRKSNQMYPRREIIHTQLHRYSGYGLMAMMVPHITAGRLLPLWILDDPSIIDLTLITNTLWKYPVIFHVYYVILGTFGMYHSLYGINLSLRYFNLTNSRFTRTTWINIFGILAALSTITIASLSGFWYDIEIPFAKEFSKVSIL